MGQDYAIMQFNHLCRSGDAYPIPTLALPLKGRELAMPRRIRRIH